MAYDTCQTINISGLLDLGFWIYWYTFKTLCIHDKITFKIQTFISVRQKSFDTVSYGALLSCTKRNNTSRYA